jgi:3-oxoadipate CoA-transferase beta subunit
MPGGSYFHHNDAFLMIRGGHIDLAMMGAFEVSEAGDLANWTTNDPHAPPGVGGAMDLAAGAKDVRILVEHTTKEGAPRIKKSCTYPLTAAQCVSRIYTNLAVIDVTKDGLVVREMVEGLDLAGLQKLTEPKLTLANDWKKLSAPVV